MLHPELPTCKKATGLAFAKYRKLKDRYVPRDPSGGDRGAGCIDFAIGPYARPEIGVEFCLKYGWAREDGTYDFVKMLDARNPFTVGFSHTLILRDKNLSREHLENRINSALQEAIRRLDGIGCADTRDVHLAVSEVATHDRRHWHYDTARRHFIDGLVAIPQVRPDLTVAAVEPPCVLGS